MEHLEVGLYICQSVTSRLGKDTKKGDKNIAVFSVCISDKNACSISACHETTSDPIDGPNELVRPCSNLFDHMDNALNIS